MALSDSFLHQFDTQFHEMLHYQGSKLISGVMQEPVVGETLTKRQNLVGKAKFIDNTVGLTEYTRIKYGSRKLTPRAFVCPIMIDQIDIVKQGYPNITALAQQAANSCGKMIDEIILQGIGGIAVTENGNVNLPESQTIYAEESTLDGITIPDNIKFGLSASKIALAAQMLSKYENPGPYFCVATTMALAQLRADPRLANIKFNEIRAFANGVNNPYAGISGFTGCEAIPTEEVTLPNDAAKYPKLKTKKVKLSYAYVYAMPQIYLGCSMPLTLKQGQNPERYFNESLMYEGMYDCVRMQEESVVRIEVIEALLS